MQSFLNSPFSRFNSREGKKNGKPPNARSRNLRPLKLYSCDTLLFLAILGAWLKLSLHFHKILIEKYNFIISSYYLSRYYISKIYIRSNVNIMLLRNRANEYKDSVSANTVHECDKLNIRMRSFPLSLNSKLLTLKIL